MISIASLKGRPNVTGEFVFDISGVNYDRIYLKSTVSQTVWVRNRDLTTQTVVLTAAAYQLIYKLVGTTSKLPVVIKVSDREKITDFGVVFISGVFPNISVLTSLTKLTIHGWSLVDFNSPSLIAVQNRLKILGFEDGWVGALDKPEVINFLQGLSTIEEFIFRHNGVAIALSLYSFIGYHTTKIKRITFFNVANTTLPDLTANTALTYLSFEENTSIALGGLDGNCIDNLPNTNTLKYLSLRNGNATLTNIDIIVNKIYAWANANANNNVTFPIGGNNASPTGTYDGTTDWSGGLPTSPKAKLWHLVNSRSWVITYTP